MVLAQWGEIGFFYTCALNILKSAFLGFNKTVSMKKVKFMFLKIFDQSCYCVLDLLYVKIARGETNLSLHLYCQCIFVIREKARERENEKVKKNLKK